MYESFNAPSIESLNSIFNMLQKIVSQLAKMGKNIFQKDLNMMFLRSLPADMVVWRNKPDLETMRFDDLYNNFKILEQEVKRMITSSSSSGSQNMAFLSTHGSTNEVNTTTIQVSTISTPVSTVSAHDNIANLSDATVYAFLANQPNGSQLVYENLEQIHEDDLEEMHLKRQLALLSMRARRYFQRTGKKIKINRSDTAGYDKTKVECFNCHKMGHFARECRSPRSQESRPRNQDNSRKTVIIEDTSFKAMVAIDGAGLFAPPNIDFSSFGLEEFKQPEFESYGPEASKSVYVDTSNVIKKASDAPIIEDWVFDCDEDESKEMVVKSKNVQHKPEQVNQPRKVNQNPKNNITNWNKIRTQKLGVGFQFSKKACFVCESFRHLIKDFLTKSGIVPISTAMQSSSRQPGIMFAVCACSRFQVQPKVSHMHAVKRIFRYLKGQPTLVLWYPKDSTLELIAYLDSDYAEQTIMANSTAEAEYITASSCCGQVLWLQNQLLDYGYNFMQTKIHVDNESAICVVKNLVYHSKTKHIKIRLHFIRHSYKKRLIEMVKIHIDSNVSDLLTTAFDVTRLYILDTWNEVQKWSSDENGIELKGYLLNDGYADLVQHAGD
nr:hypothetical protein [Tanacetum cinerariifolium]